MTKHGKIAICISGQTRGYNQNITEFQNLLDELFLDFDYDLYGHTWDDCELPKNAKDFKNLLVTDQEEIWKFSKNHFFDIVPHRSEWNENSEYIKALEGKTSLVELCKKLTKNAFGQFWSAYHSFNIVDKTQNYSLIVRMRWDNTLAFEIGEINRQSKIENFRKTLLDFKLSKNRFSGFHSQTDVLVTNEILFDNNGLFFNDVFFILKSASLEKILNNSIDYSILNIYQMSDDRKTAHHLWSKYLIDICECKIGDGLDCIIGLTSINNIEKENKKWML